MVSFGLLVTHLDKLRIQKVDYGTVLLRTAELVPLRGLYITLMNGQFYCGHRWPVAINCMLELLSCSLNSKSDFPKSWLYNFFIRSTLTSFRLRVSFVGDSKVLLLLPNFVRLVLAARYYLKQPTRISKFMIFERLLPGKNMLNH